MGGAAHFLSRADFFYNLTIFARLVIPFRSGSMNSLVPFILLDPRHPRAMIPKKALATFKRAEGDLPTIENANRHTIESRFACSNHGKLMSRGEKCSVRPFGSSAMAASCSSLALSSIFRRARLVHSYVVLAPPPASSRGCSADHRSELAVRPAQERSIRQ